MNSLLIVLTVYLAVILAATFYVVRIMGGVEVEEYKKEFYVGGRDLGVLVTAILIAAGACSTGTFLGGPGLTWSFGPAFESLVIAQTPMNLYLLGIWGKKMGIISRRINAGSFVDLIKGRYEEYAPLIFTLVIGFTVFLLAYLSAEFIGGARVLENATGLPFGYGLLIFGGIVVAYTSFGGLRGAGIVGVVQGSVMTIASLILVGGYLAHFGGTAEIFTQLEQINPELLIPPGAGMSWPFYISLFFMFSFGIIGLPHAIQGVLGYDSTKTLRKSIVVGVIIVTLWSVLITWMGGAAGKALTPTGIVPDHNILVLARGVLPGWVAGLIFAGVLGAAQTTIAAMCILISSALVVNLYEDYINPEVSNQKRKKVINGVTLIIGAIGLLLGFSQPPMLEFIIMFAIGGLSSAIVFPLLAGFFWPRANKYGAFAGALGGLLSYIVLKLWGPGIFGPNPIILTNLISGILTFGVSLATEKPPKDVIRTYFGKYKQKPKKTTTKTNSSQGT